MIQLCQKNKQKIIEGIREGKIDSADVCYSNLIDAIILKMKKECILEGLESIFIDKRAENQNIPISIILTLSIAAKMKIKTSLTDIPYAITDGETMSELGYNLYDTKMDIENGLLAEGTIRNLINKNSAEEFIDFYNDYTQKYIFEKMRISPDIHILDCTEIEVPLKNKNYEKSEVIKDSDGTRRGYKISSLRGLFYDTGIIEEIKIGSIKTHDLELSREMILETPVLKPGDILINDRGFICRNLINKLKTEKKVDTYVPVKRNMEIYEEAVSIARKENKWYNHPNKKRKTQRIAFVSDLKEYWRSNNPQEDVDLNACVVHDKKTDEYFVFVTTDTDRKVKQIIKTYELRPEIEEDFRQIKGFWKIEDFKSTLYKFIVFHIVMVLIGYMFFQIYTCTEEGEKFSRKTLPVAMKKYIEKKPKSVVIFSGQYFAVFGFLEFVQLYAACSNDVRTKLDKILTLI